MIENMSFDKRKKEALTGRYSPGHIEKEYKIESDVTLPSGLRTIVLQEIDRTEFLKKVAKFSIALAEKIGGGKAFAKLLYDTLRDHSEKDVDRMIYKVEGGEPVGMSDRCFHLLIGDGRRKGHEEIVLKE